MIGGVADVVGAVHPMYRLGYCIPATAWHHGLACDWSMTADELSLRQHALACDWSMTADDLSLRQHALACDRSMTADGLSLCRHTALLTARHLGVLHDAHVFPRRMTDAHSHVLVVTDLWMTNPLCAAVATRHDARDSACD